MHWKYILLECLSFLTLSGANYTPDWESIDSRPLPEWYDNAKVGIFIHFGVFSVPGFVSEWFWCYWKCPDRIDQSVVDFMKNNYPPNFTYQDFARDFKLEFYNATDWVRIFESSGAKYVVLTSKHHEGYTLWPSKYSYSWNSMDVGPHRDIVGELEMAVRKSNRLHFGLYHSFFEWFNPLFLADVANNFSTRHYAANKGTAELYELVENYGPDLIWSDGDPAPVEYWDSLGFLAWLYNESQVKDRVVVNDRWGDGTSCKHGGFLNCADRYNPGTQQTRKWENAMTLDKNSWGFRRNAKLSDYLTTKELLITLAQTVSNGGNLLVNVGPTKEGTIPTIMQERLEGMGQWLKINGEAIYSTKTWISFNDTLTKDVYYTSAKNANIVFAMFFDWPGDGMLALGRPVPSSTTTVQLLGFPEVNNWTLKYKKDKKVGMIIKLPNLEELPTEMRFAQGWVVKITNLDEHQRHIKPKRKN